MAGGPIANAPKMHNPTVAFTLLSIVDEIIRCAGFKLQACLPAIVEEYDREKHEVTVRPLVKFVDYDKNGTELGTRRLTLLRLQTGGFLFDMPVYRGDVGWMMATDRNAEIAKRGNGKIQEKDTCRLKNGKMDYGNGNQGPQMPGDEDMHSFLTGFFVPDSWAHIKIPDAHKDDLVIQNIKGDGKSSGLVSLSPDGTVTIESDKKFLVDADIDGKRDANIDGTLTVKKGIFLGDKRISISEDDIAGKRVAKFRKVRFAVGYRNGRLVYQTAYMLTTAGMADGGVKLAQANNGAVGGGGGGGGGDSFEYTMQSGSNSAVRFSVNGGTEQSTLAVNSNLDGKTVSLNVYYV